MKVLVAGGTGYLGAAVSAALRERGHVVTATSRSKVGFPRFDLSDPLGMQAFVDDGGFDAILNVAATGVTSGSSSVEEMRAINVEGAAALARAAASASARPYYVHVASSTELRAAETPESTYSASKGAGTAATREVLESEGMGFSITTVHNAYGPTQPSGRFVTDVVRALQRREKIRIDHPGRIRDFCYVDDVAAHIASVIEERDDGTPVREREIGSGQGTSLRGLAELVCEILGVPASLVEGNEEPGRDRHPLRVADAGGPGFMRCPTALTEGLARVAAFATADHA